MTDCFIDEDLLGQWTLRILGDSQRFEVGTIKGIQIDYAVDPANWIDFNYSPS